MFIIGSLGYTLGSLVSGHLYDKLNVDAVFSVSAILAGSFTIFIPMSSSLAVVISVLCLSKVFQGSLDSGTRILDPEICRMPFCRIALTFPHQGAVFQKES